MMPMHGNMRNAVSLVWIPLVGRIHGTLFGCRCKKQSLSLSLIEIETVSALYGCGSFFYAANVSRVAESQSPKRYVAHVHENRYVCGMDARPF